MAFQLETTIDRIIATWMAMDRPRPFSPCKAIQIVLGMEVHRAWTSDTICAALYRMREAGMITFKHPSRYLNAVCAGSLYCLRKRGIVLRVESGDYNWAYQLCVWDRTLFRIFTRSDRWADRLSPDETERILRTLRSLGWTQRRIAKELASYAFSIDPSAVSQWYRNRGRGPMLLRALLKDAHARLKADAALVSAPRIIHKDSTHE